jgi:hypothetical protein
MDGTISNAAAGAGRNGEVYNAMAETDVTF